MKDEDKRRQYDLIYPSIKRNRADSQSTRQKPPPASTPQTEAVREAAQLAALRKEKEERSARWKITRNALASPIFEMQRAIRRLEQDIKNLATIAAAEKAEEARKNNWGTWMLSPLYNKKEESEEEKARKDRQRQERRIEKDMKERRLSSEQAKLQEKEEQMKGAQADIDGADSRTDQAMRAFELRRWNREARELAEKERLERERLEKIMKRQREQRDKEAAAAREAYRKQQEEAQAAREASWKRQVEARAAELARQEEHRRQQRRQTNAMHSNFGNGSTRHTSASNCAHGGWWDKNHGRTACPECYGVWNYLLECPGYGKKACPKCQSTLRPRFPHHTERTDQRRASRPRSEIPHYYTYDDYDD